LKTGQTNYEKIYGEYGEKSKKEIAEEKSKRTESPRTSN